MSPHLLTRSLDRAATIFILMVAACGILIPLSNLLLPAGSFLQVPTYLVALWGKYVCYAILALAIDMFWVAALMVLLVPGLLAFCFGWLAFRSRVTGVYLSIITQAMTYALLLAFFRNDFGFGGNNCLTDFKDILGFNVQVDGTRAALFLLSCLALIIVFLICRAVVTSKLR